jgi:vacuolar protein sorting-associated protein 53
MLALLLNSTARQDLLSQMSLIREKATESEAVVRNITKDIQALDVAKKNLILSMTTLKRLQMLGTSCSDSKTIMLILYVSQFPNTA